VSFTIPSYSAFIFDISKDSEKINYQVSYSPYSVLSLKILRRDIGRHGASVLIKRNELEADIKSDCKALDKEVLELLEKDIKVV
ncbi:hypothetical protein VWN94_10645, partial [Campylobacter coli]|nr:hypothetical protein [Campylobacter coli]